MGEQASRGREKRTRHRRVEEFGRRKSEKPEVRILS